MKLNIKIKQTLFKGIIFGIGAAIGLGATAIIAVAVSSITTFNPGDEVKSAQINTNFNNLKNALAAIPNWEKGTTESNAVYMDGRVGIKTEPDNYNLEIAQHMMIKGANNQYKTLYFKDTTSTKTWFLSYRKPGENNTFKVMYYDGAFHAFATFATNGNVGLSTGDPTEVLDVNSDNIRIRTSKTPATASDICDQGEISWDAGYIYVCTATDTWVRAALSSW
jgi:hypothetical protein